MRETIFFNRDQLKIIRWYGYLYYLVFEYGIWIFSALASFVVVWLFFFTSYFSHLGLKENIDVTDVQNQLRQEYLGQRSLVSSFSGFQLL
ncbi:MAG: hypothetical protein Q4B28_00225 [bacterium]|nr:hypothetical protein [bacterium]